MATETYAVGTFGSTPDIDALTLAIINDATITTSLTGIANEVTTGFVDFVFASDLSAPEKTALDAIVAASHNVPTVAESVSTTADICDITEEVLVHSLAAAIVLQLPPAAAYPTEQELRIADIDGTCSGANTVTITAFAAETIDGGGTHVLNAAYADARLISDGVSKWALI